MKFGKKAGTINSGPGGGTGDWPKSLRPGETRARFVAEIADWQEYWEHFDETVKFFPCTGDKRTCPGCTSPNERTAKASKRYLAPVLDPQTGRVYGLKIGQDLANRLSLRNDRNGGTITNRDYTLIRSGQGLDTEYDVEQEEKVAIDLGAYENVLDLEDMLAAQFAAAWPDFDPDNPPVNGRAQRRTRRDDDDEPAAVPRKRASRKRPAAQDQDEDDAPKGTLELIRDSKVGQDEGSDDDPPSKAPEAKQEPQPQPEPEPEPADEDGDGGEVMEITEDDLQAMSRTDLMKLARQAELPVTLTMSREEIINKFLSEFAE